MNSRPSDVISFRKSLRDGTGCAMLLLKADTSSPVLHEALLQACFVNDVYDRQCEDSRETYLHKLIIASGAEAFFRQALLERLNGATEELPFDVNDDIGAIASAGAVRPKDGG